MYRPFPRIPTLRERVNEEHWYRETQRKAERAALPVRAYVDHDAEACWILDRDTPGAFAAARAANRLRVLNAVPICPGCDGQGFCQCDPLTAAMVRDAGPLARPEFD
jgi:hypothetical protein